MVTSLKNDNPSIELIKLLGKAEENFYQLGSRDAQGYKILREHIERILKIPGNRVKRAVNTIGELSSTMLTRLDPEFKSHLRAYAEGLEVKDKKYLFSLLLPELASNLGRWLPGLPSNIGCSSYFGLNSDQSPVHLRVLDFSLAPTYSDHERAIHYNLEGTHQVMSYSTAGLPFPALHGMSEQGFSLALHQKFTPVLEFTGAPIFQIVSGLLFYCRDEKDIREYIESATSITTWGINILLDSGKVLELDIAGDNKIIHEHQLKENEWHYVNNRALEHRPEDTFPVGVENYCDMRYASAKNVLQKLNKKTHNNQQILKTITLAPTKKSEDAKRWNVSTVTMSSLSTILFDLKKQNSLYTLGSPPKFFSGEIAEFSEVFKQIEQKKITLKCTPSAVQLGYQRMMLAQKAYDFSQKPECYHHIQMSIEILKGYPEQKIAQFYFLVYQYLFDHSHYSRHHQHSEFLELYDLLPSYLRDHAIIFIHKIEKELRLEATFSADDICHPRLKTVYQFDKKIPFKLIHKLFTYSIIPRIDILDVIYAYLRI